MAPRIPPKPKALPAPKHTQWEVCTYSYSSTEYSDSGHHTRKVDGDPEAHANELGAEGWEPVTLYRDLEHNLMGVYKRPKL